MIMTIFVSLYFSIISEQHRLAAIVVLRAPEPGEAMRGHEVLGVAVAASDDLLLAAHGPAKYVTWN